MLALLECTLFTYIASHDINFFFFVCVLQSPSIQCYSSGTLTCIGEVFYLFSLQGTKEGEESSREGETAEGEGAS